MSQDRFDRTAQRVSWARAERRDPRVATQQLQWHGIGQPQTNRWQAQTAVRSTITESWVVARCVELIANDLSRLPFRVGDQATGKVNDRSPLGRMLSPPPGGPAPKVTARRWWAYLTAQRLVTGQMAAELDRGGNRSAPPVAAWPIACGDLRAIPTDSGSSFWAGFVAGRGDKPQRFTPDELFYDWVPSAEDFRQPWPVLASARLDVSVAVQLGRYQHAFLRNGGVPAHVVITERFPTDAQSEAFRDQFASDYQGASNAGKVAFLEVDEGDGPVAEAISIHSVGLSQKDAQFLESQQASLEHVAMALGVPWSRLSASDRTFDNATAEALLYWESTILPLACDMADAVNIQLAPLYGSDLGWFDLDDVAALRSSKFTGIDLAVLLDRGVVVPNEVREDLDLEAMEGGDVAIVPPAPPAPPMREAEPLEVREPEPTPPPAPAPEPEKRARLEGEARAAKWRAFDAKVTTLESRWKKAAEDMFARQAKSVAAALGGKRGAKLAAELRAPAPRIDPDTIYNRSYWQDQTTEWSSQLYADTWAAGAAELSGTYGIAFDLADPRAVKFISERANNLAGQVTDTTYNAIKDVMAEAVMNGDSIETIGENIQRVFDVASSSRAETIARTEVVSAYNGSQADLAAWPEMADVVGGMEWLATPDARTRDDHAARDGQIVSVGDAFDGGLMYPGDPSGDAGDIINCRCTTVMVAPEDMPASRARTVDIRTARTLLRMAHAVDPAHIRTALEASA
jgi:HK97 family phage portal protein